MHEYLTEYIQLHHERDELEAELKHVCERIAALREPLVEWMACNGTQSVNQNGRTVYLKCNRYVSRRSEVSPEDLQRALRETQWDYLVKPNVNARSLQCAILEALDSDQPIPQSVLDCLTIGEQVIPAVRSS